MEILQTIWNVLTTENERLANIFICPFSFIESYLYMLVFITLLNIKTNSLKIFFIQVAPQVISYYNKLYNKYIFYTTI